jgi:uncharacterized protein YgfB (UPF0149 family)
MQITQTADALAQWMIKHGFVTGHGDTLKDLLSALSDQIDEMRSKIYRLERHNRDAC